jgi:phage FluMu protein Com
MPIEFRCPSCNALLRVPDDAVGRQAKCPKCATLATVTPPPAVAPPPVPPSGDSPFGAAPTAPAGSPFPPAGSPFASDPGGDPNNPYRSPGSYSSEEFAGAALPPIVPTAIGFEDVFRRAWEIFKQRPGFCIGAWFLAGMITNGLSYIVQLTLIFATSNMAQESQFAIQQFGSLFVGVISIWINCGQMMIFLGLARGRDVSLGELFSGGPYLLRVIGASILLGLIAFGGFLLLIVPGIIFMLMFWQCLYLIVDRNVGVMESLNLSREITRGNKATMFLAFLAMAGLMILGAIPCFLGWFVAFPYSMVLYAVMYLSMTGQPTAEQLRYSYPPAPAFAG